ncbi:hypothetical protein IMY05_003G0155400 [Salix suchowensis]|nr:hypothetical protein IMY05_003G0155400 [Salix suchowensis]
MPTSHSSPSMLFPSERSSIILYPHPPPPRVHFTHRVLLRRPNQPGSDYLFSCLSRFFLRSLTVLTSTRFSQQTFLIATGEI